MCVCVCVCLRVCVFVCMSSCVCVCVCVVHTWLINWVIRTQTVKVVYISLEKRRASESCIHFTREETNRMVGSKFLAHAFVGYKQIFNAGYGYKQAFTDSCVPIVRKRYSVWNSFRYPIPSLTCQKTNMILWRDHTQRVLMWFILFWKKEASWFKRQVFVSTVLGEDTGSYSRTHQNTRNIWSSSLLEPPLLGFAQD